MQALRALSLYTAGEGAAPTPLPVGCCPGDLAEVLEFLQVRLLSLSLHLDLECFRHALPPAGCCPSDWPRSWSSLQVCFRPWAVPGSFSMIARCLLGCP